MTADTSSPLDAVKTAGALLSFGPAHNWTFEQGFKKHNAGAIIHGYDHTVSFRTVLAYSFGQLLRAIARLNAGHLGKAFAWIDYKLFFRADRVHFRQRIWRVRQDNSVTVDDAFGRLPTAIPTFVKVDIEGSEYRILDDLLRHSADITALPPNIKMTKRSQFVARRAGSARSDKSRPTAATRV